MKLSELVAYRNQLDLADAAKIAIQTRTDLERIQFMVEREPEFGSQAQQLAQAQGHIQAAYEAYHASLDQLRQDVQNRIDQQSKHWFQESYRLYQQEMVHESVDYILDRRCQIRADIREIIRARLGAVSDWQRPGMIIRPGREDWISHMVGLDPLYILDQHADLLQPALGQFPELYQNRLRKYVIDEHSDQPMLRRVPDGQIGVCLIYYLFNFRPIEVIRQYLTEIFAKMKPGGTVYFTFNNCDNSKAVQLVESSFCCYTPGGLIRSLAQGLGYDILYELDMDGASTWLELRKPGDFVSLRGGQVLTRVLPIL